MEWFDSVEHNRGRKIALSMITVVLVVEVLGILHFIAEYGWEKILNQIVFLGFVGVVAYLFFKGYKWAGFILMLKFIQNLLIGIFFLLEKIGLLSALDGWLMLILTILIAIIGGIFLGGSDSLTAFLSYQKQNRK